MKGVALGLLLLFTVFPAAAIAQSAASSEQTAADRAVETAPWQIEGWYVFTSVYTRHFDPEEDHNDHQNLLGLELWMNNRWLFGFSAFDNSFDQNSQYLYVGYRWELFDSPHWYLKLTGGLLHGYKEPYEDKIPLNGLGVAPAVVPTLGFRYRSWNTEVSVAGTSAVVVTTGITF